MRGNAHGERTSRERERKRDRERERERERRYKLLRGRWELRGWGRNWGRTRGTRTKAHFALGDPENLNGKRKSLGKSWHYVTSLSFPLPPLRKKAWECEPRAGTVHRHWWRTTAGDSPKIDCKHNISTVVNNLHRKPWVRISAGSFIRFFVFSYPLFPLWDIYKNKRTTMYQTLLIGIREIFFVRLLKFFLQVFLSRPGGT